MSSRQSSADLDALASELGTCFLDLESGEYFGDPALAPLIAQPDARFLASSEAPAEAQRLYPCLGDTSSKSQVRVREFSYPDGSRAGFLSPVPTSSYVIRRDPDAGVDLDAEENAWRREENGKRSRRRSKQLVTSHIRQNNLTQMMTFTNGAAGEGWATADEALDHVREFIKSHGHRCFGSMQGIAVAERGKDGRLHVHAFVKPLGFLPYAEIIGVWTAFLTRKGYVSTSACHRWHRGDEYGKGKKRLPPRVAAAYAAKYLTKDMEKGGHALGRKRFRTVGLSAVHPIVTIFESFEAAHAHLCGCKLFACRRTLPDGGDALVGYSFDFG